jgi:hypothetical protein
MKIYLFAICFAALIIAGCYSIKTIDSLYYSGQISYFDNTADYYSENKIMKCKLSDTAFLDGYKCISWIWFFENGRIKQFETAEDLKINNIEIPSKSTIFFSDQNPNTIKYIWFSKDVIMNNIECKGGGKISTEFYDNGSLKACFLSKDQYIQGYPCKSSLLKPVYFYPDGKIKILTLGIDSKFENTYYKAGESIIVGEDGKISKFNR